MGMVGASTLRGQEVKTVLSERKFPIARLVQMDRDEDLGRLSEFGGEPVVSLEIIEDSFESLDLAFFVGDPESTRRFAPLAERNQFLAIDLTHAFPDDPRFPLCSGSVELLSSLVTPFYGIVRSPHPAALVLTAILERLSSSCRFQRGVVNVFEPVSEHGSPGVEELERQTLNILSFQPSPQAVFDRQLAFNLLSRLGDASIENLQETEKVIVSHLRELLKDRSFLPALTVIQVPVFHSYCFSMFLESDSVPDLDQLESALRSDLIEVIPAGEEPPSPVQAAGTDLIQVGGLKADLTNPRGLWLWAVADNLRLAAINSVAIAEQLVGWKIRDRE